MSNTPLNCQCFCPSADTPAPLPVQVNTGASQLDIQVYGTAPFSASILQNPILPSGPNLISSVAMYGSTLRVIFSPLQDADYPGNYSGIVLVCNACGKYQITVTVQANEELPPPSFDCDSLTALFTPLSRDAQVGDQLFAREGSNCVLVNMPLIPPPFTLTCSAVAALFTPQLRPMEAGDVLFGLNGGQCVAVDPPSLCNMIGDLPVAGIANLADAYIPFREVQPGPTVNCGRISIADVLASVPGVNVCNELQSFLSAGPLAASDRLVVLQGATCTQAQISDLLALVPAFDGGAFTNQLLGPDGSCAAPTYSFSSDPASGLFYDPSVPAVTLGYQNCDSFVRVGNVVRVEAANGDFIEVGASINIFAQGTPTSHLQMVGRTAFFGTSLVTGGPAGTLQIAGAQQLGSGSGGAVLIEAGTLASGGSGSGGALIVGAGNVNFATGTGGSAVFHGGDAIGPGGAGGSATLRGGSVSGGSLTAGPAMLRGGSAIGAGATAGPAEIYGGDGVAGATPSHIAMFTGSPTTERLRIAATGEWLVGGSPGVAGDVLTSAGPGAPPIWAPASGGSLVEPAAQVVYGTGLAVSSSPFFLWDQFTGRFNVNQNASGTPLSFASPVGVTIRSASRTGGLGDIGVTTTILGGSASGDNGGQLILRGGDTSAATRFGGDATLQAGSATGSSGAGGTLNLYGGNAIGGDARGGRVNISPGLSPGVSPSAVTAGVKIGPQGSNFGGDGLTVHLRPADETSLIGMGGNSFEPAGQNVRIRGGPGFAVGNNAGGRVDIGPGQQTGTGARGVTRFTWPLSGLDLPMGYASAFGDWVLAGYGNGTLAGVNGPVPPTATTGFVYLPRVNAAPTGTPAPVIIPGPIANWAVPFIAEPFAGGIRLWAFDFAASTWRNVTLT